MNYKNDISFVFDFELLLYEHQSTLNPNMPLRDLLYVTRVLQNRIKNENLYSKSLIKIPENRFIEEKGLLTILEEKMSLFRRNVEELRIRAASSPDTSVQIMTLPEPVCCMRRCTGFTIQEKYDGMYDFFHECIENGYVLARVPLFLLHERTDYLEGRISKEPYPLYVCVPVRPESAPKNAVRFPSCKVLSILGYDEL